MVMVEVVCEEMDLRAGGYVLFLTPFIEVSSPLTLVYLCTPSIVSPNLRRTTQFIFHP